MQWRKSGLTLALYTPNLRINVLKNILCVRILHRRFQNKSKDPFIRLWRRLMRIKGQTGKRKKNVKTHQEVWVWIHSQSWWEVKSFTSWPWYLSKTTSRGTGSLLRNELENLAQSHIIQQCTLRNKVLISACLCDSTLAHVGVGVITLPTDAVWCYRIRPLKESQPLFVFLLDVLTANCRTCQMAAFHIYWLCSYPVENS